MNIDKRSIASDREADARKCHVSLDAVLCREIVPAVGSLILLVQTLERNYPYVARKLSRWDGNGTTISKDEVVDGGSVRRISRVVGGAFGDSREKLISVVRLKFGPEADGVDSYGKRAVR